MATSSVGRTTINGSTTVGGFNPLSLFAAGEQGVWYDPSDFSTLFQDSAGTIPVTALEQPVGRMLDKSGRGNHATQSTNTSFRPVVSARVNFLTYSNVISNAIWDKNFVASVAQNVTDPFGIANSAWTLTAGSGYNLVSNSSGAAITSGTLAYLFSAYVKAGTNSFAFLQIGNATASSKATYFNLSSGTVGTENQSIGSPSGVTLSNGSISSVGNGWYRLSVVFTQSLASNSVIGACVGFCDADANRASTAGNTGALFGVDLRPTNQGVGLPVYQRVGAAVAGTSTTAGNADYDANGFPVYLSFDGSTSSRFLLTSSINLSGTSLATVFVGARKLSDANAGVVAETVSSPGQIAIFSPSSSATANYGIRCAGSADNFLTYTTYTSPVTNVISSSLTTIAANAAAAITTKINGTSVSGSVAVSGNSTGNFANSAIYIGARAGTSLFYNGLLYGLIVRGASSTANQITGAENWLNQKTAAY